MVADSQRSKHNLHQINRNQSQIIQLLYIQCNSTDPITHAINYFCMNDITFFFNYLQHRACERMPLFVFIISPIDHSQTNERSFCLTAFESVVVTYCETKHHFAMHSNYIACLQNYLACSHFFFGVKGQKYAFILIKYNLLYTFKYAKSCELYISRKYVISKYRLPFTCDFRWYGVNTFSMKTSVYMANAVHKTLKVLLSEHRGMFLEKK